MNICKICLKISDNEKRSCISKRIKQNYIGNLDDCNESSYPNVIKELYDELGKNAKILFTEQSIIVVRNLGDIKYYILDQNKVSSRDQITLDVIIAVKETQLTNAVYQVFNDIKQNLKAEGLEIEYNPEIVYVYLTKHEDVLDNYINIKAKFDGNDEKFLKNKKNISQIIITLLLGTVTFFTRKYDIIFGSFLGATISFFGAMTIDFIYYFWIHHHNRIIVKDFESKWFDEDKKITGTQDLLNPQNTGLTSAADKVMGE